MKEEKLSEKVYAALRKIPKGKVTTYKILGDYVGCRGYRAIGRIVGANPDALKTPCHRVVASDGGISGYAFGVDRKLYLLSQEGLAFKNSKKGPTIKNFERCIYHFK